MKASLQALAGDLPTGSTGSAAAAAGSDGVCGQCGFNGCFALKCSDADDDADTQRLLAGVRERGEKLASCGTAICAGCLRSVAAMRMPT